ncbi:MAG: GTPase Era [Acidobacteria bacterium]|nr:GTPase Era [Acidobacteriota bacterium]
MPFRSGFVAIIGRPNAGKSTLLNALAGEKLAIVSPKAQTTRTRVLGVLHVPGKKGRPQAQVVVIDTPGVHRPDSALGRKMMHDVQEALNGSDLVLVIVDARAKQQAEDEFLIALVKGAKTPAFLLLNKIDLLRAEKRPLLPLMERYSRLHEFREIIPISARKREGLDLLVGKLLEALPEGPPYFPPEQITDQPARFMAAELVREQVFIETSEEVPHSTTVVVEQFEEGERLTRIAATIYCERDGQKRILVGRHGQMLKKIGTAARLEIEKMLQTRVFLELFVKVHPNWRDSRGFVEGLDWRRQLEHLISAGTGPGTES